MASNMTVSGNSRFDTGLVTTSGAPTTSDAAGNLSTLDGSHVDKSSLVSKPADPQPAADTSHSSGSHDDGSKYSGGGGDGGDGGGSDGGDDGGFVDAVVGVLSSIFSN